MPHGDNPPLGAVIYYNLSAPATHIALDVLDAAGTVVRYYASDPSRRFRNRHRPCRMSGVLCAAALATGAGMHRINWDVRYEIAARVHSLHGPRDGRRPRRHPLGGDRPARHPRRIYASDERGRQESSRKTVTVKNDPVGRARLRPILAALHDLQIEALQRHARVVGWVPADWRRCERRSRRSPAAMCPRRSDAAATLEANLTQLAGPTTFTGGRGGGAPRVSFSLINASRRKRARCWCDEWPAQGHRHCRTCRPTPRSSRPGGASAPTCGRPSPVGGRSTPRTWWPSNALLLKNNLKPVAPAMPMLPLPVCGTAAPGAPRGQ